MPATQRCFGRRRYALLVIPVGVIAALVLLLCCNSGLLNALPGGGGGTVVGGVVVVNQSKLIVSDLELPVRVGDVRQLAVTATGQASPDDIIAWHLSGSAGTIGEDGAFIALSIGRCRIWASYTLSTGDGTGQTTTATTNQVTIDIWPKQGPSLK